MSYEPSYDDGLWIKMACMPVALTSKFSVDGSDFVGLEVWEFVNRGKGNILLLGKNLASASKKLLKENRRLQEGVQ